MQEGMDENAFSQSFVVVNSENTIDDALRQATEADVTNLVIIRKVAKSGRTREFIISEYYVVSLRQLAQIFSSFGPNFPLENIIDKVELAQTIEYDNQDIKEIRESLRESWGVVLERGRVVGLIGHKTGVTQTLSLTPIPNSARFINAELEDHDEMVPLQLGMAYTLAFNVNIEMDAKLQELSSAYGVVELDVQLYSNDFEINADWQSLYILSNGKSKNKARFTIRPKFIGEGEISAIFLKSGNFIQLMNIKIQASASDSIGTLDPPIDPTGVPKVVATRPSLLETESRQPTGFSPSNPIIQTTLFNSSPNAIWTVKPRDLSLVIIPIGTSNFRIILTGVIVGSADLRITLNELQQYIEDARIALNGIVEYVDSKGEKPYQISVSVDSQIQEETQRILATAGFILFQRIFYGRDPKAEKLGDELRRVAKIKSLNIQIVSDEFRLPWGILYLAERLDTNNIDPSLFLGLNHIVEYRSLNLPHPEPSLNIDTSNGLCVSLNLDYRINAVGGGPQFIDSQVQFWKNLPQGSISLLQRNSKVRVLQAFISMNTIIDQLMYFNCHAQAISPASDSWLELSDGVPLTLKELEMYAGVHLSDPPFPGRPLVFINACDSAKLSPLFYSGFIPYLLMKGARGAIGTECNVPTVFATEWALMFFKRFLTGVPLGDVFLFMRQVYYYRHNNILGLLYAVYCDSDTFIDPHIL